MHNFMSVCVCVYECIHVCLSHTILKLVSTLIMKYFLKCNPSHFCFWGNTNDHAFLFFLLLHQAGKVLFPALAVRFSSARSHVMSTRTAWSLFSGALALFMSFVSWWTSAGRTEASPTQSTVIPSLPPPPSWPCITTVCRRGAAWRCARARRSGSCVWGIFRLA